MKKLAKRGREREEEGVRKADTMNGCNHSFILNIELQLCSLLHNVVMLFIYLFILMLVEMSS